MPLVITQQQQTPIALTIEQQQAKARMVIQQKLSQSYLSLQSTLREVSKIVWQNLDLTPQQVLDGVGSDAANLFRIASLVSQIMTIASGVETPAVRPENYSVVLNQDGTVTVALIETQPE